MGICIAPGRSQATKEDESQSKIIDRKLRNQRKILENEIKLLLLGTGESGKSTIARQLKIIYMKGFSEEERIRYSDVIFANIQMMAKSFVEYLHSINVIQSLSPSLQDKASLFFSTEDSSDSIKYSVYSVEKFSKEMGEAIAELWACPQVKEKYNEACVNALRMGDTSSYFFDNINRISEPNYIPTEQDMLHSRTKTSGVSELVFEVNDARFKIVDVGGQRSERSKWIHCFQDVTALLFCVALSEYDLGLSEDTNVNRMHESLALFEQIINCQWFSETPVILFLNKSDLFEEKVKRVDLSVCFPDYKGGSDLEKAKQFVVNRFSAMNKTRTKQMYCHVTCATNTDNITRVFEDIQDVIIKISFARSVL